MSCNSCDFRDNLKEGLYIYNYEYARWTNNGMKNMFNFPRRKQKKIPVALIALKIWCASFLDLFKNCAEKRSQQALLKRWCLCTNKNVVTSRNTRIFISNAVRTSTLAPTHFCFIFVPRCLSSFYDISLFGMTKYRNSENTIKFFSLQYTARFMDGCMDEWMNEWLFAITSRNAVNAKEWV